MAEGVREDDGVDTYSWMDRQGGEGGYNWEDLHPKMMEIGDKKTFAFQIKRERTDGLSFSAEAVEALARGCLTFFLARAKHFWDTKGEAAQKATVTITVTFDGEEESGPPEVGDGGS